MNKLSRKHNRYSKTLKRAKEHNTNQASVSEDVEKNSVIVDERNVGDVSRKTRFQASMLLHALGDTIGFKNGDWEFNYHERDKLETLDYVNELIYEFIALGGVNGVDLSTWKVSDDTFLHIAIAKAMLKYKDPLSDTSDKKTKSDDRFFDLLHEMKLNMWDEAKRMWDEAAGKYIDEHGVTVKFNRYIGYTTSVNIDKFTDTGDARTEPYDDYSGGNGAAMRTLVIGLCLSKEEDRDVLIDLSVLSSQLTHNNSIGYLAGFTSALFTALAMEKVDIKTWPYILIEYLRSDKLKKFLSLKNLDQIYDHSTYIKYWQKYIDTKFDIDKQPIRSRANTNPMHRIRYYHDNFHRDSLSGQIGDSGFLCMIMAYDSLLDCDGCWEKLLVYAMLHSGDSDTIGAVAGGLYGAVYGFGDVPDNMLKYIERKDEIIDITDKLYKKFK